MVRRAFTRRSTRRRWLGAALGGGRWTGIVGAESVVFSDDFEVLPVDAGGIISLAQARKSVGLPAADTSKDDDLRELISDATPIMEDLCGPILHKTRVETQDGGSTQIGLIYSPLISVSSVIES